MTKTISFQENSPLAELTNSLPLNLLPICIYEKNRESIYTYANEHTLALADIASPKDFLDKSDKDLPWKNQAELLQHNDKEVMSTGNVNCAVETLKLTGENWASYLTIKVPSRNDNKRIQGIHGTSLQINMLNPTLLSTLLSKLNDTAKTNVTQSLRMHALNLSSLNDALTVREKECLLHVARGRSSREIGHILELSNRTVECHINNAKVKLGCTKKSQLIDRIYEHFPHFWLF